MPFFTEHIGPKTFNMTVILKIVILVFLLLSEYKKRENDKDRCKTMQVKQKLLLGKLLNILI